ncbi:hypothetical protein AX16_005905 [Volvariella volvacea WC 439]|nr:hypothetical protein AX16_005905 [Volvariella volvacea WC 439]
MLLSNLTSSSAACATVLSIKTEVILNSKQPNGFYATQSRSGTCPAPVPYPTGETRTVPVLPLLVDAFVQGAQVDPSDLAKRTRKGDLHFLASVFANVTVSPAGREFFLTPCENPLDGDAEKEYPLAKVVSFTEHKDTIRRGGVASIIKNCCFNSKAHQAILTPSSEKVAVAPSTEVAPGIDVLPNLLLPLAGPEEFDLEDQEKLLEPLQFLSPDKKREQDTVIRLTHVESLLLLCHTRWGRDYQRQHGVYEIVRATHENETVDKISEHIERLVMLIKGEEPKDNLDEDDSEKHAEKDGASDDEDSRIEEV